MNAERSKEEARRFHEGTKHPKGDLLDPRHRYDSAGRPPRVKEYQGGERIPLPPVETSASAAALQVLLPQTQKGDPLPFDLRTLSRLLHFSGGATKHLRLGGLGRVPFRAASCTGALYHIELYVVWAGGDGLAKGLYAYAPEDHELIHLRSGDSRQQLSSSAGDLDVLRRAPLSLIYTSAYWRNAVKYQARAYRHAFWDSGTILANNLALATAYGWRSSVALSFIDLEVEALLGIEQEPEVPLFIVSLGEGVSGSSGVPLGELEARGADLSGRPTHWPAIEEMHRASSLPDPEAVRRWREATMARPAQELAGTEARGRQVDGEPPGSGAGIEEVIRRRGSSRRFKRAGVSAADFWAVAERVHGRFENDVGVEPAFELFGILNGVEGLAPGAYAFRPGSDKGVRLREGNYRREAGILALNQALGADAAFNLYWLVDLDEVCGRLGARGYRLVQLQAAMAAGCGYLAAYALELGATGLTFFDDAVVDFFGPAASGREVLFLLAVGHPA